MLAWIDGLMLARMVEYMHGWMVIQSNAWWDGQVCKKIEKPLTGWIIHGWTHGFNMYKG